MLFGFSTGTLSPYLRAKEALLLTKKLGCQAVELGVVKKIRIDQGQLDDLEKEDLSGFKYISLHAPKFYYCNDGSSKKIEKPFGKSPDDLEKLFSKNKNFKFIMDVNHIKTNDSDMKLADEFYDKFRKRLTHFHISGLSQEEVHTALYRTRQLEILSAVKDMKKPVICESRISPEEIESEKKYIEDNLISK